MIRWSTAITAAALAATAATIATELLRRVQTELPGWPLADRPAAPDVDTAYEIGRMVGREEGWHDTGPTAGRPDSLA